MSKGIFLSVEGGEGAGKSTLIRGIARALEEEARPLFITREPGGTPLGEEVRKLLLIPRNDCSMANETELLLFLAARAQNIQELISPALKAGKVVISDRFNDSTIAYQGIARGIGLEEVERLCRFACGALEPQLTFLLDIDPEEGLKRAANTKVGSLDRIEQERLYFHERVRQGFLTLHKRHPTRICLLDGRLSPEALVLKVLERIRAHYA